jgi:hypothetical protein
MKFSNSGFGRKAMAVRELKVEANLETNNNREPFNRVKPQEEENLVLKSNQPIERTTALSEAT